MLFCLRECIRRHNNCWREEVVERIGISHRCMNGNHVSSCLIHISKLEQLCDQRVSCYSVATHGHSASTTSIVLVKVPVSCNGRTIKTHKNYNVQHKTIQFHQIVPI